MNNYKYKVITLVLLLSWTSSCISDLNTEPLNKQINTSASVFKDPASYKQFLAKLYGSLTLTGQRGEFGMPEINAPDEGTTSFLRGYWKIQELTTDEAISAWNDAGLNEYRNLNWSSQNGYNELIYQRIFINIAYCNEYIREVTPRLADLPADLRNEVTIYLAEARFLRALFYYYALDLWGNVPFVTEADKVGAFLPRQIKRVDLFSYIESELESILPDLIEAGSNEYARADKAAAWMLLAKLYLNAEVYLGAGNDRYEDCIANCENIINAGYSLTDNYGDLFLADNDSRTEEIIFSIAEDGNFTRNYGGVTFIIHAQVGGSLDADNGFGIASGGWNGNRLSQSFVDKFEDLANDSRAMIHTDGQTTEIASPFVFTEGYLCTKFKNITSTGVKGKNATFVDTDFPLFRLADVYLMYAEAVKRGGGGNPDLALTYVNLIRERAYGNTDGNIISSELSLDFILEERARELFWECHRRTDLIRYGYLTSNNYLWNWKGNVMGGTGASANYNLMPLPASDLAVNTNLKQNKGY